VWVYRVLSLCICIIILSMYQYAYINVCVCARARGRIYILYTHWRRKSLRAHVYYFYIFSLGISPGGVRFLFYVFVRVWCAVTWGRTRPGATIVLVLGADRALRCPSPPPTPPLNRPRSLLYTLPHGRFPPGRDDRTYMYMCECLYLFLYYIYLRKCIYLYSHVGILVQVVVCVCVCVCYILLDYIYIYIIYEIQYTCIWVYAVLFYAYLYI